MSLSNALSSVRARRLDIGSPAGLGFNLQWRADDNYTRKFFVAVLDLLLNFDNFW